MEGVGYEVHIEEEMEPKMHFCLVGIEVEKVAELPTELFVKTLPAGECIRYTHQFNEGDYGDAFIAVYDWIARSEYQPAYPFDVQCYDERFKDGLDPGSEIDILVPVVRKLGE